MKNPDDETEARKDEDDINDQVVEEEDDEVLAEIVFQVVTDD